VRPNEVHVWTAEAAAAHVVLRDILSWYLDRKPDQIEFRKNQFGKPFLVDAGPGRLEFNLSHSASLVTVALALQRPIGVDVERIRPLPDLLLVAEDHFAPPERALLAEASPPDRLRAFFTCWTRKEAYIKALGTGLSAPLNTFDASIPAGAPGRRIESGAGFWWVADLPLPEGYAGAIAIENGFDQLRQWRWTAPLSALPVPGAKKFVKI